MTKPDNYGDFLIVCLSLCGITWGIADLAYGKPQVIVKRVETCSPRSVDNYSTTELRRIAGARDRLARTPK